VINVSETVKKVFMDVNTISPYIQEMLNPGDTQVTEMKLKMFTLEMKELVLEKKFKSAKLSDSLHHYKVFFFLLIIYFGIYFLIDYVTNSLSRDRAILYLVFLCVVVVIFLLVLSRYFETHYYTSSHLLAAFLIGVKILMDWLSEDVAIALSA
jgi:phospholipid-translocating ATPase